MAPGQASFLPTLFLSVSLPREAEKVPVSFSNIQVLLPPAWAGEWNICRGCLRGVPGVRLSGEWDGAALRRLHPSVLRVSGWISADLLFLTEFYFTLSEEPALLGRSAGWQERVRALALVITWELGVWGRARAGLPWAYGTAGPPTHGAALRSRSERIGGSAASSQLSLCAPRCQRAASPADSDSKPRLGEEEPELPPGQASRPAAEQRGVSA